MLLLGAGGMGAGLALDAHLGGLETLAALCSGPTDLGGMLALHLRQLPLAHLGMVAGGLVVIPLMLTAARLPPPALRPAGAEPAVFQLDGGRHGSGSWCSCSWLAGAARCASRRGPGRHGGAGMVWGMVASVSLVQALIRLSYGPPPSARGGP